MLVPVENDKASTLHHFSIVKMGEMDTAGRKFKNTYCIFMQNVL